MKKKLAVTLAVAFIGQTGSALASDINFSGYGSIKAGMTLNDDFIPPHFDYDNDIDFKNESLFALQAKSQLNDLWSATIVLQARGENDFDLEARWAYLSYDLTPDTTLSFGRFALPYFRNSDTQDIGYSHNYSRLPKSVYRGQAYDVVEGVRITHTEFFDDSELTFNGSYSNFSGNVTNGDGWDFGAEMNDIIQGSVEYTYDWFSLYVGAVQTDFSIDNSYYLDTPFKDIGYKVENGQVYNPYGDAVYDMDDFYSEKDKTIYLSTGFSIDYNQWLVNAEYAVTNFEDSFFEDAIALYASVGYQFDKLTVSIVHQDLSYDFKREYATSSDPYVNAMLNGISDYILKYEEYDAQGIHFRYDAAPGIAYKFEYTHVNGDLADDSTGIVTAGIDFVF